MNQISGWTNLYTAIDATMAGFCWFILPGTLDALTLSFELPHLIGLLVSLVSLQKVQQQ